jgi:hypothetical protein
MFWVEFNMANTLNIEVVQPPVNLGPFNSGEKAVLPKVVALNADLKAWIDASTGKEHKPGSQVVVDQDLFFEPLFEQSTVTIQPGVGMLALFPSMNYKAWFALGEMVDNSIQSYKEHKAELKRLNGPNFKLKIDIEFSTSPKEKIVVRDNAAGIYKKDIARAFTPAVRREDLSGIGQFGIGMKSSATWYANHYVIRTAALGEPVSRTVTFDIPAIIDNNTNQLPIEEKVKDEKDHGTTLTLTQLHQGIPTGATLGRIRGYLQSIYRDSIRSGEVKITVGGKELEFTEPTLLTEPYWKTDKRPAADEAGEPIYWRYNLDFELKASWLADNAPDKPNSPPRITGWVGILKNGTTKASGLALLWRGKVVVGAGSAAQGDEDSYRPKKVFGTSNTFPFQRIVGEVNVSELQVTTYKDNIKWRPDQEDDFQNELRKALEASTPQPMLRMARNYRSTQDGPEVTSKLDSAVKAAATASTAALVRALDEQKDRVDIEKDKPLFEQVHSGTGAESRFLIYRDSTAHISYFLEVISDDNVSDWLRMLREGEDHLFVVNRKHPFMESFAHLPGADLDPILRIAIALALAEIKVKTLLPEGSYLFRGFVNTYMRSGLANRFATDNFTEEQVFVEEGDK